MSKFSLALRETISVRTVETRCPVCKTKITAHNVRNDGHSLRFDAFICPRCANEVAKPLFRASETAEIPIDLAPIWAAYHEKLVTIVKIAANQGDDTIIARVSQILTEAANACGRRDIFDFTFDDEVFVVNYVYAILKERGLNGKTFNDLLYLREFVNDYQRLIPSFNTARMVQAVIAPQTAILSILGLSGANFLGARFKRAATLYSFGHIAFLLMMPK